MSKFSSSSFFQIKENYFKSIVAWIQYDNAQQFSGRMVSYKGNIQVEGGENTDNSINKITCNTSNPNGLEELHAILCVSSVYG
ncbi:hypothetical protein NC651_010690 [Populus alba x Populus x berolinensis]|nr:hypothetical protein NC651_010690 [Populus alba x Populus x berolinensis]